jgi:hypothetical protein
MLRRHNELDFSVINLIGDRETDGKNGKTKVFTSGWVPDRFRVGPELQSP